MDIGFTETHKQSKKTILFLAVFLFLGHPLFSQGFIIDHNCIDISKVPESWITQAKATYRLSYGHTSHGSQIVSGMQVLMGQSSLYSYNYSGSEGALSLHDYTPSGDLGNPNRSEWYNKTRILLDDPSNDRNMIMWSWCGQVSSATQADIDLYLGLMNQLEIDYPGVTFVYMTGHLDGTGETGNLHLRNEQIRNFCRTHNKILFDFADIESYDPDGNYFLDKGANDACDYWDGGVRKNWATEWCSAHPGECSSCSCAHSHSLNCDMKGRAFWWMMAKLAGWDGGSEPPFGQFDTPLNGTSGIAGAIPVTGWALDDIGVSSVTIWRSRVGGEGGGGPIYVGDAVFVEGARPDVESAHPGYPNNNKAGWGYMLLTNFLPGQGNGTYTFHAYASDVEGNQILLGTKTISCDNANASKPFGTIDTPVQGGSASGSNFINFGWALTPQPNCIPTDGSTIQVYIDGVPQGAVNKYNEYRADVSTLFSGYCNTNGPVGFRFIDTTSLSNGVHTLAWAVTDTAGNTDGIGSRFFTVDNAEGTAYPLAAALAISPPIRVAYSLLELPWKPASISIERGFSPEQIPEIIYPSSEGRLDLIIEELERIQLDVGEGIGEGYQLVGNELRPLPVGANLDTKQGIFSWIPGPGFLGDYDILFVEYQEGKPFQKMSIRISIHPKSNPAQEGRRSSVPFLTFLRK